MFYSFSLLLSVALIYTNFAGVNPLRWSERWVKLNPGKYGQPLCFEAKNNKPGKFNSQYAGFFGAVKLVHRSGGVSCTSSKAHFSHFGCYGKWRKQYQLNVVVTNSNNEIKFPTCGFNPEPGSNPAFFYGLDGRDSRSKEIVLQHSFATPYYVNQGQELRVWFGEDLFDKWDGNNIGRSCVDVYGYLI